MRIRIETLPTDAVQSVNNKELFLTPDGNVYGIDLKGYYEIKPYINKCNSHTNNNKYGYYKFHYQGKMYRLHYELARLFVPGYKPGLCVDHIDNNSLNNKIENLQWLTRGENAEKFWDSLTDVEMENYKRNFSNALREAHKAGHYKNHLDKLHKKMK